LVYVEANLAHNVMMRLLNGQEKKGHVVMVYFPSIELFMEVVALKFYTIDTTRSNCMSLSIELEANFNWRNSPQDTLQWKMYESCGIVEGQMSGSLHSTHTLLIDFLFVRVSSINCSL